MHSNLFVFIGVPILKPAPKTIELQEQLELQFSTIGNPLQFLIKDRLISLRHNEVSYYVSILDSKKDVREWVQMAKNFEISTDTTILTEQGIALRYDKLRITRPNFYSETEYSIAETIFRTMRKFNSLQIISFQ